MLQRPEKRHLADRADRFGVVDLLRLLLLIGLATLVLPTIALRPGSVAAQSRSVEWAHFDVTLDLRQDGSYHVEERQQVNFSGGPFRGGFRDVPLAHVEGHRQCPSLGSRRQWHIILSLRTAVRL